jgi:hypothetical protein
LGHRNNQHTLRDTELSPTRFKKALARLIRRAIAMPRRRWRR